MTVVLIDTHAFLWWIEDSPAPGASARALVNDPGNPVDVSAASAWEISSKRSKGTLEAPPGDVAGWIAQEGFTEMPVSVSHGTAAGALPPHHHDPFDRVLVAQARLESLTLLTAAAAVARYDVALVDART